MVMESTSWTVRGKTSSSCYRTRRGTHTVRSLSMSRTILLAKSWSASRCYTIAQSWEQCRSGLRMKPRGARFG